jgi:hypothetical protein
MVPVYITVLLVSADIVRLLIIKKTKYSSSCTSSRQHHYEIMDNTMDQALRNAVLRGRVDDVRILLDQDVAKLHVKDWWDGSTLLHQAARRGHVDTVQLLLARGANANERDFAGHTPLHFATLNHDDPATIQLLLEMGDANANQKSSLSGNTALHYASAAGFTETACLLLDHEADLNAKNKQGLKPMDVTKNTYFKTILYKCHLLHTSRQKLAIHRQLHVQKHSRDLITIQAERDRVLELQRLVSQKNDTIVRLDEKLDMAYHMIGFLFVVNVIVIPMLIMIVCYWRNAALKKKAKK